MSNEFSKSIESRLCEEEVKEFPKEFGKTNGHIVTRPERKQHKEEPKETNEFPKDVEKPNEDIVSFEKTYSFRNLPKGRVASLQKKFEASGFENYYQAPTKEVKKQTPKYRSSKILTITEDKSDINSNDNNSNGTSVPIRSWEDASYSSASQSSIQSHTR